MSEEVVFGAFAALVGVGIFFLGVSIGMNPDFVNGSSSCISVHYQVYCKSDKVVP